MRSESQVGKYHKNLGEFFYDRDHPEIIYSDFLVKNPLKNQSLSLKDSIKTCSCVVLKLEKEKLSPGETTNICLGIHPDTSNNHRHEQVIFKTGVKEFPIIQLSLSVITVPTLSIDFSQYFPPKLKDGEKTSFNIFGTAYLSNNEDISAFSLETNGLGISLKNQKRIIQPQSNGMTKLTLHAKMEINCHTAQLQGILKIPATVSLGNKNRKFLHEFYWLPVYPFLMSHYQIFLNSNSEEPVFVEIHFNEMTTITKLHSKNSNVELKLVSPYQEKNHRIKAILLSDKVKTKNQNTIQDEIEIYINDIDVPIVTIPVFILNNSH
jgi:hypothetical protein